MDSNLITQLKGDEALRLKTYPDPESGTPTIGYGHNISAHPLPFDVSKGITSVQSDELLQADVTAVETALAKAIPWILKLDDARYGVMINMGFNLGVAGLLKFVHMLAAMKAGDYRMAAMEMINSKWYTQVGRRAVRLVSQMQSGQWVFQGAPPTVPAPPPPVTPPKPPVPPVVPPVVPPAPPAPIHVTFTATATTAVAGDNQAVPLTVMGYLVANIEGTEVMIPYFRTRPLKV